MGRLVWLVVALAACAVALGTHVLHDAGKEGMTAPQMALIRAMQALTAYWKINQQLHKVGKPCALTYYSSYPETAAEGIGYNGYEWSGLFKGIDRKKSLEWVKNHNIAAVHSEDWARYGNKWVLVGWDDKLICAKVIDVCADVDTPNKKQCTLNKNKYGKPGFLIDLELNTAKRIGFKGMDRAFFAVVKEPPANSLLLYGTSTDFK